jgi:hypothetical protein
MTETTATVENVRNVRQAKALLELREAARMLDQLTEPEPWKACQAAIHARTAEAFANGATMAQVAVVMADGAGVQRADTARLRQLVGRIPAGSVRAYIGRRSDQVTIDDLLDDLEASIESNRQMAESYEADREELRKLRYDLAAVRRVFGVAD